MTKRQVNLYNAALRQPRELVSARNLGVAAVASLLLIAAAGAASGYSLHRASVEAASAAQSLKSAQDELASVTAQLASRPPDPSLRREVEAAQSLLKSREEVLAALADTSIEPGKGFADYLRALARQSLQGVWLTAISIGPGSELALTGRTLNQSLVAQYVKRLTGEPVFAGREFSQLSMAQVPEKEAAAKGPTVAGRPLEFQLTTTPVSATPSIAPSGATASSFRLAQLVDAAP